MTGEAHGPKSVAAHAINSFPRSAWECRLAAPRLFRGRRRTAERSRRHSHAERGNEFKHRFDPMSRLGILREHNAMSTTNYKVHVTKDYLVFSSGHFITYCGDQCERIHGHNYRVAVAVKTTWMRTITCSISLPCGT